MDGMKKIFSDAKARAEEFGAKVKQGMQKFSEEIVRTGETPADELICRDSYRENPVLGRNNPLVEASCSQWRMRVAEELYSGPPSNPFLRKLAQSKVLHQEMEHVANREHKPN